MLLPAPPPELLSPLRRRLAVRHLILPDHPVAEAMPLPRETLARFLKRTGWRFALPTVVEIDGVPVLRRGRGWARRRIRPGETVVFVSRPGKSGGSSAKSVLGLVAMIAMSVLMPGVGGAFGALLGLGELGGKLLTGALMLGGALAVNALIAPKASGKSEDDSTPLYDFGPQSNSARLRESLPVQYGRLRKAPDFAAIPWTSYEGNDQYLHVLLVDGEGRYDREKIEVGDTELWTAAGGIGDAFKGVEIAFYDPGQPVTLFPTNIFSSPEVSGQELAEVDDWVGTFTTNPSGTRAIALACDFIYPAGLYSTSDKGETQSYASHILVQVRPIDDVGAPSGGWRDAISHIWWGATKKPVRFTRTAALAPGRYQVRARRVVPSDFAENKQDSVMWAGMRASLQDAPPSYPVSVTAIRIRATDQLSGTTATQFRTTTTRILPVWTGDGWEEKPTRSPAWALIDIARDDLYGCGLALADIDTQAIVDLAAINAADGDCFDHEFRAATQATDALDTPLRVCRARHRWLGSTLSLVREHWRAVPSMLLTDREIVRGSMSIKYLMQPEDAADAIVAEYMDETSWQAAEVQVPPDITPSRPMYVQWPGAVRRAQVARLTSFLWQQHTRRRVLPSLSTERDGRLLGYGDVVSIQSDLPQAWGQAAAIVRCDGLLLTFDRALEWAATGQHYIRIRTATGRQFGPVMIARSGLRDEVGILDAADLAKVEAQQAMTLAAALARADGAEPPSCAIGIGEAREIRALVLRGRPSGQQVQLDLVVDDPAVYEDGADPGAVPPEAVLADAAAPQVTGLVARIEQNVLEPVLHASWWPAAGALRYEAQVSYDGRETWQSLGSVTAPGLSAVVQPEALSLRVQAIGRAVGAFAVVDLPAPEISSRNITITADNFEAGLREQVAAIEAGALDRLAADTATLGRAREVADEAQTRVALALAAAAAAGELAAREDNRNVAVLRERLAVEIGAASAAIEEARTVFASADAAVAKSVSDLSASILGTDGTGNTSGKLADVKTVFASADAALASQLASLTAALDDVAASVTVKAVASASVPSGAVAAYQVAVAVDGAGRTASGGLLLGVFGNATDGYTSRLYLQSDSTFFMDGAGARALFALADGKAYLNADLIASGSITGAKIAAGAIDTERLAARVINADKIMIGGVTTMSLAQNCVTNIVAAYAESAVAAGDLITAGITRTPGTILIVRASFRPVSTSGVYGSALELVRTGTESIRRASPGGAGVIHQRGLLFPYYFTLFDKNGVVVWQMGGNDMFVDYVDADSVDGYAAYTLNVSGYSQFSHRMIELVEYKR